jgi:hypothetical protein
MYSKCYKGNDLWYKGYKFRGFSSEELLFGNIQFHGDKYVSCL